MSGEPGRITGVGGVFRRARDPDALRAFTPSGWVTDPEGNRVELWEPVAAQTRRAVGSADRERSAGRAGRDRGVDRGGGEDVLGDHRRGSDHTRPVG